MKKIIAIYLSIFLFITGALSTPVISHATIDTDKIVQGYSSSFSTGAFSYAGTNKYYILEDPSDIPSHNGIAFFGKNGQEFYIADGKEVFTYVINKQLSVVVKPGTLANLFSEYVSAVQLMVDSNNKVEDGVYDGSGNFLGLAMEDISGCYYQGASNVTIPVDTQVNIYNFIIDETEENKPDYIIVEPGSEFSISAMMDALNSKFNSSNHYTLGDFPENLFVSTGTNTTNEIARYSDSISYVISSQYNYSTIPNTYFFVFNQNLNNHTDYDNFCNALGLNENNNTCSYMDIINYVATHNTNLRYSLYAYTDNNFAFTQAKVIKGTWDYESGNVTFTENSTGSNFGSQYLGSRISSGTHSFYGYYSDTPLTIYRDLNTRGNTQNNYQPNFYNLTYIQNVETNNLTDITVSNNTINNSTENNSTLYDQSETVWNDNSGGNVNQTIINQTIINNITTIYEENTNSGEDNSGEGNSGEGGNGGSGNGGITLDALLAALLAFFDAIGRVIATIITGLLTIFTDVLNALASIQDMFSGITAFFGALFGYLPEPIPAVLAAGVCLVILCAIIKFIRG